MLTWLRLWLRRWWAARKPYLWSKADKSMMRSWRQTRERGNVLLYLGKRRGQYKPTS